MLNFWQAKYATFAFTCAVLQLHTVPQLGELLYWNINKNITEAFQGVQFPQSQEEMGRNKLEIELCYFAIVLKNVPALALEPTLESLDNGGRGDMALQQRLNSTEPLPKTMNSNASLWGPDKTLVLILCHIYLLITYLLFQFFPSLQPSCLRILHLWWERDKNIKTGKHSNQGKHKWQREFIKWTFLFFSQSDACLLIKSMACALSCSALCKSARMSVSATFSTERLLHRASSHMTFKRSRAYWGRLGDGEKGQRKGDGGKKRRERRTNKQTKRKRTTNKRR